VEAVRQGVSVTDVARLWGVSRQAVYDWLRREAEAGMEGLEDGSRRPHSSPHRTAVWIEERLIAERKKWGFGAKKILRRLQDEDATVAWPPRSTVDVIFKRAGLVEPRPHRIKRPFAPGPAPHSYDATEPGMVMTADYKGQFRLGNRRLCYPLTVADPVSRFLYVCDAHERINFDQTWMALMGVFREYGMPKLLHTDNGIPFGTSGHGRFSSLSVRLMKYGIQPVYSRPGHPQDNGRHERMHRTLLERTALPPAADFVSQQQLFDEFRQMFNEERPHEALGQDRPARHHRRSSIPFPDQEPTPVYEGHFEVERVDPWGRIRWAGKQIAFSEAFANQSIAFEPVDYRIWNVHFASFLIGTFDATTRLFR
jgi:transposase InsO family protein